MSVKVARIAGVLVGGDGNWVIVCGGVELVIGIGVFVNNVVITPLGWTVSSSAGASVVNVTGINRGFADGGVGLVTAVGIDEANGDMVSHSTDESHKSITMNRPALLQ